MLSYTLKSTFDSLFPLANTHTHTHHVHAYHILLVRACTHTLLFLLVSLSLLGCRAGYRPVDLHPVSIASPLKGEVASLMPDYLGLRGAVGYLAVDGRT